MSKSPRKRRVRKIIAQNPDGSFTLFDDEGASVTLTFLEEPVEGYRVVVKSLPKYLPDEFKWVFDFGVQDADLEYLPGISYELSETDKNDEHKWVVYYYGEVHELNDKHTSPGDPPVGHTKP